MNFSLDCFGNGEDEIQISITTELEKIFKWLDVNKLCLNTAKSKYVLFHMPQGCVTLCDTELSFSFNGIPIKNVKEFNFLGLIIDSNLNWKAHLNAIGARITGLLRKLKYIFPKHILHFIYNSLIMPHLNYMLLACGTKSHKIELLQKRAVRLLFCKLPIALIQKQITILFRNAFTRIWAHRHILRNDLIRLPVIRCEFGE